MLGAAGGFFPSVSSFATLGTFTPPNTSADLHSGVDALSVTERSLWSDALFSETTVEMNRYRSEVLPQSSRPMELLPETTLGSFFNHQTRTTSTYQAIETLSGTRKEGAVCTCSKPASISAQPVLREKRQRTRPDPPLRLRPGAAAGLRPSTVQSIDSTDVAFSFRIACSRARVVRRIRLAPRP